MTNTLDQTVPSAVSIANDMANVTISGTTAFIDNAVRVKGETRVNLTDADLGPAKLDNNGIADFLAKPRIIASGAMSSGQSAGTLLYSTDISTALTSQSLWAQKLSGYGLIRATACFKIVFNANPFQAGRVIFSFLPCYRHFVASNSHYPAIKRGTLEQVTMTPNVEMDLKDASLEMEIPYITPYAYYNLIEGLYDWGTVFLQVLSPLRTGSAGVTVADFNVYLSFKDVELAAPRFSPEADSESLTTGLSGGSKKKTLRKEQRRTRERGFFEDTLDKVGDVGELLSDIPVIGGVAQAVGGAAKIGSAISSIFGWSKPLNTADNAPVFHHPFRNMQNINGPTTSDSLSAGNNPVIEPNSGVAGTNVDEMSFAYLKSIPMLWRRFDIPYTTPIGTKFLDEELNYASLAVGSVHTSGTKTFQIRHQPPFVHIADCFTAWRGSLKLTLKFVKTNFHSGRVMVTWSPNASASSGIALVNNAAYVMREIIDLRTTEEITLILPYLKGSNYISIRDTVSGMLSSQRSFGYLTIAMANAIVMPETVASSIEVLAYISAGDDLEYSNFSSNANQLWSPEGGGEEMKVIGSGSVPKQSLCHNVASTGDMILSIKQLMQIAQLLRVGQSASMVDNIAIYPFANGLWQPNAVGPVMPHIYGDLVTYFSTGFSFMRGGMRITANNDKMVENTVASLYKDTSTFLIGAAPTEFRDVSYFNFTTLGSGNPPQQSIDVLRVASTGSADVTVPYYSPVPLRLIDLYTFDHSSKPARMDVYPYYAILNNGTGNAFKRIYRSAADDYSVHYFTGFPPVVWRWDTEE